MNTPQTLRMELTRWQTKILLKALNDREAILRKINADESNEDAAADAANDILDLRTLKKELTELGLEAFGPDINNLSDEPI